MVKRLVESIIIYNLKVCEQLSLCKPVTGSNVMYLEVEKIKVTSVLLSSISYNSVTWYQWALLHASVACHRKLCIDWVPASDLEDTTMEENPESYKNAWKLLKVNPDMVEQFEDSGLSFTGKDESGRRMEVFIIL
ncbi:hypothetical protein ACS0TY_006890 [Phlomoides rotata]